MGKTRKHNVYVYLQEMTKIQNYHTVRTGSEVTSSHQVSMTTVRRHLGGVQVPGRVRRQIGAKHEQCKLRNPKTLKNKCNRKMAQPQKKEAKGTMPPRAKTTQT